MTRIDCTHRSKTFLLYVLLMEICDQIFEFKFCVT
jgi:hypothetical protein